MLLIYDLNNKKQRDYQENARRWKSWILRFSQRSLVSMQKIEQLNNILFAERCTKCFKVFSLLHKIFSTPTGSREPKSSSSKSCSENYTKYAHGSSNFKFAALLLFPFARPQKHQNVRWNDKTPVNFWCFDVFIRIYFARFRLELLAWEFLEIVEIIVWARKEMLEFVRLTKNN